MQDHEEAVVRCKRCGSAEGSTAPCEYLLEIHGDETPCATNCCAACRDECAEEI
jgi:hypothetical protein